MERKEKKKKKKKNSHVFDANRKKNVQGCSCLKEFSRETPFGKATKVSA